MSSPRQRPLAAADRLRRAYGTYAVVTGASDGIGRALAMRLAEAGFGLVLVARRKAVLEALADELEPLTSSRPVVISADLSVPDEIARIDRDTASLDVGLLVAAAGFGTSGPFVDGDLAAELNMIDVNCRALAQLTHIFAHRFAARRRGGIVLMSSLVAFQGVPRAANYAATKAFVQSLAEGLAPELKPLGVDVLASAPGPVMSGFGQRARMAIASGQTPDEVAVGTLNMLGRRTTVRPGFLAKALEASLMLLPRAGRAAMLGRVMAGFTRSA
ncbi:SDR family NAD(P)-dependent oxidoreductase [Bradyrhizobium sp. STM 3809]|uniref:SDR family NAD(P)-dependent oxidoreductase n=1 Tax=Bradyrhizobium sp. STM 3809 TaxID=551936 RepID=UPI00024092C6|nr:SDR family NAD(P)-dependent oxidoreductase [Bradyrhizobium sp. STM 3809]CCE00850.1 putative oxidoreductase, short-chain dehydrogenase/reductase family [Bradyrhizobium sp. STM 3809]